jgi:hypothetical protein
MSAPEDADDRRDSEPDVAETAEFAKMRAVMRAPGKHREGGVDPELEVADAGPGSDTWARVSARRKRLSVKALR